MGACLDLCPLYGRSAQGQRAYGTKPTARGTRNSTVGALGIEGLKAALCFEGTLNAVVFLFFLEHGLLPHLQPGDIVLLDNAAAHRVAPVQEAIDLAWSKVKHRLRKAQARTKEALYHVIAEALQTISSHEAKAFFQHVGVCI